MFDVQCSIAATDRGLSTVSGTADGFRSAKQRFFQRPVVAAIGMAMAMRGEKAAAMAPEQRPDLLAIGLRQRQLLQRSGGKEFEAPFRVRRRPMRESLFHLKQKHEPVRLAFVTVFADKAGQMKISE